MMEFNEFQQELAALTEEAIIDLGGRLDAYQRMFNEELISPPRIQSRPNCQRALASRNAVSAPPCKIAG